jgi:hypothetical protein
MNDDQVGRDDHPGQEPEFDSPEWEVSIGPGTPATVVLKLSKGGRTIRHRLDTKAATKLSNALIVEAERAQFKAAYAK